MEWYRQGRIKVLGEKSVSVLLCLPQILCGLAWDWPRGIYNEKWLTAWGLAWLKLWGMVGLLFLRCLSAIKKKIERKLQDSVHNLKKHIWKLCAPKQSTSFQFYYSHNCKGCSSFSALSHLTFLMRGDFIECSDFWVHVWLCAPGINPLKPELNPICYLLALLGVHHFLHVSRIRVKSLTFRLLMSYIYGAPILDVSRSHTTTQHSR